MQDSTRKWCFVLLISLFLWSFLFFTRFYWFTPWCAVDPSPCTLDTVNPFDQLAFRWGLIQADFWSNVLQNFCGVTAFTLPWLILPRKTAGFETLRLATVSMSNLALIEIVRTLVQRPRPLIYNSPLTDGKNVDLYTSFYSGHTSFVALATLSIVFMIKRNYPTIFPKMKIQLIAITVFLSVLTGVLRVVGGRHYPTDVIAGFTVGICLTLIFNRDSTRGVMEKTL